MCGINGIYRNSFVTEKDAEILKRMNSEMRYRGPDDSDVWISDEIGLAHTRLSIIGVDNGHQPIHNEDRSVTVICNGEIYNYKELRYDLKKRGHQFSTDSDTEVIVHLFEEKGISLLNELRGMFAFALWNRSDKKLFIARDRSGKKPLYYTNLQDSFVFSSELKAINKHVLHSNDIDFKIIRQALYYSYPIDLEDTHIKQIKRIKAGEFAIVSSHGMVKKNYWKKQNTYEFSGTYDKAKEIALNILRESIRIRLRSDVPVAILLSSGIDSSAIACLASETNTDLHAITVGYKGLPDCDEREPARKLCKHLGIHWHNLELSIEDFETYFEEYVCYIDEPVCDVAAIAQWGIYKKAKEMGFTVLLSGNGGDELFYGYGKHNQSAENLSFIADTKKILKGNLNPILWAEYLYKKRSILRKFITTYSPNYLNKKFLKQSKLFKYKWPDKADVTNKSIIDLYLKNEKFYIDGLYSFLFSVWLQANCYYLSDRLGMGNSLEIRAPFSDHMLVDFVSSLPLDFRYKINSPKWFLKDLLSSIVPEEILYLPKKGFTPPIKFISKITSQYKSGFFKTPMISYNQVLIDRLLSFQINGY